MTHNAYAVKYNNKRVLQASSSGGAFSLLSDYILQRDGFVYGAVYNYMDNSVYHIGSNAFSVRDQMRGSKYIQSKMVDVFSEVEQRLKADETVLFTGTICQISGLVNYLFHKKINCEKLYCCDIICHGVASPRIWSDYLQWKLSSAGWDSVDSLSFRDKTTGWVASHTVARKHDASLELPEFMRLYYSHTIIRESCHCCPYTNINRISDITIGDFWGIEKSVPDFDRSEGVSFLMTNTDKGTRLFNEAVANCSEIIIRPCRIEDVNQPNFFRPAPKSVIKERVLQEYKKYGIEHVIKKYTSEKKIQQYKVIAIKAYDSLVRKKANEKK